MGKDRNIKKWLDSSDNKPTDFNENETKDLLRWLNIDADLIATAKYLGDGQYTLTIKRYL